ncbi:MAG: hypothetical protein AB1Z98_40045 [Nannocystaceae bacterium]
MHSVLVTLVAGLLGSAPPDSSSVPTHRESDVMLRAIDHHAKRARRERFVGAGVNTGLAGTQLGLGIFGTVAFDDAAVRLTAIGQIVAGSAGILGSVTGMVIPSPVERLRASPTYLRLSANPDDAAASAALRSKWGASVTAARKRRMARGGVSIGIGALVTAVGSVRLAQRSEDQTAEAVWALTTVTTGVGLLVAGVLTVSLPEETERSFKAFEAGHPAQRPTVSVAPTLGGLSLAGRF